MVTIDKEYYYLDLECIHDFVFKGVNKGNVDETEEIMDGNNNLIQTTVIRNKSDAESRNIRYDMIKTMLEFMYNTGVESENGNIKYIQDMEDTSMGSKLIFNTLLNLEIIKNKL